MPSKKITAGFIATFSSQNPLQNRCISSWEGKQAVENTSLSIWARAAANDLALYDDWKSASPINYTASVYYEAAAKLDNTVSYNWLDSAPVDISRALNWHTVATAKDGGLLSLYNQFGLSDAVGHFLWSETRKNNSAAAAPVEYTPPTAGNVILNLDGGYIPPLPLEINIKLLESVTTNSPGSNTPSQLKDKINGFKWSAPPPKDLDILYPWGTGVGRSSQLPPITWISEPGGPLNPQPIPINIKEHYLIMNSISLVSKVDRTPLAFSSFSITMDIDSPSYGFSAEILNQASFNKALVNGVPTDVELNINGNVFTFIIDAGTDSDSSALGTWQINGHTRSKLLGAPYAATRAKTNVNALDAAGQASTELTPYGFVVNWPLGGPRDAVTWQLPPGVYNYQGLTPLAAVSKLAATVGAVVIPSLNSDQVTIQPRWPLLPWQLSTDNPDLITHESLITNRQTEYQPAPGYNEVTVSGESTGTRCKVFTAASGGGTPGPEIVDAWLTENPANIQRGAQALADYAPMVIETLKMVVLESAQAPIALPGKIIEVQNPDPSKTYRALILSNTISPGSDGLDLFQQLKLARPIL